MLSTAQADLLTESFAQIRASSIDYSTLFYHRLFLRHPFVRSLFPDDLTPQVTIFRATIDALVAGVHDLPSQHAILSEMGRRHVRYGVKAAHYAMVGEVLIDTLAELSGAAFTRKTRVAWETLYAEVARVMIAAAEGDG